MTLEFAHAVVYVVDMDNMVDFYSEVLDFEVSDRGPVGDEGSPEIVFLSTDPEHHHQLAFLGVRNEAKKSNSVNHLAFRCADLSAVKGTIERLEADGRATEMAPITHGNAWSIYFTDPEGNGVEIFCDTPYHVAQPQGRPWDTSLDEAALADWTQGEFGGEPEFGPIDEFYSDRRARMG